MIIGNIYNPEAPAERVEGVCAGSRGVHADCKAASVRGGLRRGGRKALREMPRGELLRRGVSASALDRAQRTLQEVTSEALPYFQKSISL